MWAAAEIRYTRDWGAYGDPKFPLSWIEYETLINPFGNLTAVDYGDAGLNLDDVDGNRCRKLVGEVLWASYFDLGRTVG